jgi:phospholipid/cholesterol/gamma-HCH transport system substrate-binding protein
MKSTTTQKIKLGIFTTIGILLLLVGIFLIGRNKNMFGKTFTLYGSFKNVGGLQTGNNVRLVGINVGTVESIEIISDTLAKVGIRLQEKVKPFIKKNAVASISSDGLMGDKLIVISAGTEAAPVIADGSTIETVNPVEFNKVMDKISNVAENAEIITDQLAGIVTDVNQGKGSIGKLLHSDELATNLEGTVKDARNAIKSVKKGTEGFSENMEAVKHNFLLRGYFRKKEKAKQKELEAQQKQEEEAKATQKEKPSKPAATKKAPKSTKQKKSKPKATTPVVDSLSIQ